MAQKDETKFKEKVLKDLRLLPNSWWEKIQQVTIRGTPDIVGCLGSYFVAIELKRNEQAKVDILQTHKLSKIEKAGGHAIVTWPDVWKNDYAILLKLSQL